MWLGNKALKAGISTSLCMLASKLLNLKYPFFAILPAVIPISVNLEETIKSSGNRLIGSTVGALIGIILALIEPSNIIITGIGVIIIIYICRFINWENSASIACLIFISIMVGIKGETAWFYSLNRLMNTFIGIAITATVNNLAFSISFYSNVTKNSKIIYNNLLKTVQLIVCSNIECEIDPLYKDINNLKGFLNVYKDQIHLRKISRVRLSEIELIYKSLKSACDELNIINSMQKSSRPNDDNAKILNKLFDCKRNFKKCEDSELSIVYNYHLSKLLNSINDTKLNK